MAPVYRFGPFELDVGARQLRRGAGEIPVQPQVFAFLRYLVEQRDRVVGKDELLERLWPDVVVQEASLQRCVSQARATLGDEDHGFIRTFSRHGYRFVAPVEELTTAPAPPRAPVPLTVRYAPSGGLHIAYAIAGAGAVDIVLVLGWTFPFRALARLAETAATLGALTNIGRVVLFDKRGTGLSDPVKRLPSLDERMDDLRAVLDAADSREAVLVGLSEGGALCMLFAAAYPDRVRGLVLVGAFARMAAAPDWPAGWSPERAAAARAYIQEGWGNGQTILAMAPRAAARPDFPHFRRFAAETEQEGASPGAALDVLEMNLRVDVRPLLGAIRAPTHVLHRTGDGIIDVRNGRALAAAIPGAQLTELPGDDHVFLFEDSATLVDAVRALAGRARSHPAGERVLATVLAVAPGSAGSAIPRDALFDIERRVASHGGQALASPVIRDTFVGTFVSPRRALACGLALAEAWSLRVAAHVGEVEISPGGGARGTAVDDAQALVAAVIPGQFWISRILGDVLPGAGFVFEGTTSAALRCRAG